MPRRIPLGLPTAMVILFAVSAQAHELWFQPPGTNPAVARLTFGDSPAPGEAERVAEIAHAKVWGDGLPLEVARLPDGLEARLPARAPAVLSAYADRGVVDHEGDAFVIHLAAYAQSVPLKVGESPKLGLGDDQLRLLLVADDGAARPVARAIWKGKPVAGVAVSVFQGGEVRELRADSRGEIACPDPGKGPASLLAVARDDTPGKREGRAFSHTRYKATLTISLAAGRARGEPETQECLARVKDFHGAAGPWAVVGYRIGARALRELKLPRHAFALNVVHRCPSEVQYSCIADGLQAATGASPGKLNLKVEAAPVHELKTVIEDRNAGRRLTFVLRPAFVAQIRDVPPERHEAEARRVATLPDDAIFSVIEGAGAEKSK